MRKIKMKTIILYQKLIMFVCVQAISMQETGETKVELVSIQRDGKNTNTCLSVKADFHQLRDSVFDKIITNQLKVAQCGNGLWFRVAYLNMSDSLQNCPSNWTEGNNNGIRACGRKNGNAQCWSAFYPTGRHYRKVCGMIIGYQVASPGAFHIHVPVNSLDDVYVDGISISHGLSNRTHIWTFAAGVTEGKHLSQQANCPCAVSNPSQRRLPPTFVGNNYFCESGNPTDDWTPGFLYSEDPLWDGDQCEGDCCSNGKSPPWFISELPVSTTDDIEVRICGDQSLSDEDNPISLLELFVSSI